MSGYGRGLAYLGKEREKHAFRGSGIRKLWLTQDGDIAKFRILTDGNETFTHLFHEVAMSSQRGKDYTKDVLCTRRLNEEAEFIDDADACKYCAAGLPGKPKGVLLVYLYAVAHKYPDAEGKWTRAMRGEVPIFIEKINEVRIWLIRNRMVDMVADKFGELGTLLDRNWDLKRFGKTGEGPVQYIFEGKDPGPPSAECAQAIQTLRPLDEVVLEEFGGEPVKTAVEPAAEVAGGAADTVPPDDEVGFD